VREVISSPSVEPGVDQPGRTRPVLRVIQGGVARPRRLEPPGAPKPAPERLESEPEFESEEAPLRVDDVPIYLRPMPAWLPRLW